MHRGLLLTFLAISSVAGIDIIPALNPGCNECLSNENVLVYTKVPQSDTKYDLHQIWDFTGSNPTVIYIITNQNSTLEIEWDHRIPISINTSTPAIYNFAISITNLFEYDDCNDTVFFNYKQPYRNVSLTHVTWVLQESVMTDIQASVVVHGSLHGEKNGTNGTVEINFQLMSSETRWEELPRLFLSPRSTLVDVGLVGLTPFCEYEAARYAVRYVVISQDCTTGKLEYMVHKTIDDEYTPGVFEMIDLLTPSSNWNASGGYLQYRPVAYTARQRSVGSSVQASMHTINKASIPSGSLAKRYFGSFEPGTLLVQEAVASFGDRGDGYYRQTNYTAWTLTMGYGLPETERTSSFLTGALVVGLVVPSAVLVGMTFVSVWLVSRARRN
ncbi:glycosylated lysosomal membrane protein A-like [Epargyreus clarus]|uniref:glycosylated lysosomal membrane protein A-like n=1 Tax=Epargyreus clarus TaxID=520877 RepID=UPI003C2D3CC5